MKKNYLIALCFSFLSFPASVQSQTCTTGLGGGDDPSFLRFNINGTSLAHETLSAPQTYYHDYPQLGSTTADLVAGQEYQIFTFTSSEAVVGLWVDYNHNDTFEENEFTTLVNTMSVQNTTIFRVSPDALPGNTKIRLRSRAFGSTIAGANACTSFGSGETRDYTVTISGLPPTCITGLGGGDDPGFLTVNFINTSLLHPTLSGTVNYYNSYPQEGNTTATLVAGQEYQIFTFTSSEAVIGIWVDYNHNNDFEESEYTLLVNAMSSQNTTNFRIKSEAIPGNTKIRFRSRAYGSTITGQNACTSFGSGQTRDYTVLIAPLPEFCTTELGGGIDPSFQNFEIYETTLAHQTPTAPTVFYHNYPQSENTTATLVAGQEYQISASFSSEAVVGIWLDYNHNNDFEEAEYTLLANANATQGTYDFTVSADAVPGATRIRLRSRAFGSDIFGVDACTSFGSGETRDYTVLISPSLAVSDISKKSGKVQVYPNPATNTVTIGTAKEVKEVYLYGISGNLITISASNVLDISGYQNGIYIVKAIHQTGNVSYEKIVKQ